LCHSRRDLAGFESGGAAHRRVFRPDRGESDYLELHGVPHTIEDLQQHTAVNYFSSRTGRVMDMDFVVDGNPSK